ncbi:serine hydrolase domain-containing protein [Ancylobacter pratisalsi]|uniref:Beta-lactamase family protein n=1 Tax=Ancylobacter pratisalsi TaxID=1745854 RepID=A0A6P1YJ27_9HYPH|nr:serine hydrolase domain-containing protein [Ancylobacter pratisalsi]QIB32696.1 beta-lactamase family protein [Ancylobacter pratisalsi]
MHALTPRPVSSSVQAMGARLDAAIAQAIAQQRIVGAVVLVSRDGEVVWRRAMGMADREMKRPMREDALFRLASVSKLFVSVAAMALVAQGRLSLDAPITTWLPAFRPLLPGGEPATITPRHLLSHTAGLSYGFLEPEDGPYHRAGVSDGMDRTGLSLDENLRRLASVPLLFAPGTDWIYSLSIDVLGAVVASAFGASLPDAVRALVTRPLGLGDTGFSVCDRARLAAAYADDQPSPRRMREPDRIPMLEGLADIVMDPARAFDADAFPSGGAGMIGTADDSLSLLETMRGGGGALLPPELAAEMARVQTGNLPVVGLPGWGYGLGFSILKDATEAGTPETPGTWRWGGAYGHSWFVDPTQKLSVVAFTNTALEGMSGGGRFPQEICRAVYGS